MSFRTVMIIKAVVCLAFGIGFIFFPELLLSIFGVKLNAGGLFTARAYGAALWGNFMLTWYGRDIVDVKAKKVIALAMVLYNGIGFIVSLSNTLAGTLNYFGWLVVFVYLFLTIGFGCFLFRKE